MRSLANSEFELNGETSSRWYLHYRRCLSLTYRSVKPVYRCMALFQRPCHNCRSSLTCLWNEKSPSLCSVVKRIVRARIVDREMVIGSATGYRMDWNYWVGKDKYPCNFKEEFIFIYPDYGFSILFGPNESRENLALFINSIAEKWVLYVLLQCVTIKCTTYLRARLTVGGLISLSESRARGNGRERKGIKIMWNYFE